MSKIGTIENPHILAPEDWNEKGVEYGSYCKCSECDLVSTSTFMFDFYAGKPGDPLSCESCTVYKI